MLTYPGLTLKVYLVSSIWGDKARSRSKVDEFVSQTQEVNLRIAPKGIFCFTLFLGQVLPLPKLTC